MLKLNFDLYISPKVGHTNVISFEQIEVDLRCVTVDVDIIVTNVYRQKNRMVNRHTGSFARAHFSQSAELNIIIHTIAKKCKRINL